MTLINFDLRAVAASGRVPVDARIRWQPVERREDGGVVILPEAHSVTLVDGVASADLDPGYYLFQEVTGAGSSAVRLVPAVGPVAYADLVAVDPVTLDPSAAPDPAWLAMARATVTSGSIVGDDLVLQRTDGTTVDAGNVRGPAGPANDAAIAALAADPASALHGQLSATYAPKSAVSSSLKRWKAKLQGDPANAKIVAVGDSTSDPATDAGVLWGRMQNFHTLPGEGLEGMTPANITSQGRNGSKLLTEWMTTQSWTDAVVAASPDLIVFSLGINDIREGLHTPDELKAGIISYINGLMASLPNCDFILRTPNSFTTDNQGGSTATWVVPSNAAQTYSKQLREVYGSLIGQWPNAVVWDAQDRIFGRTCQLLADTRGLMKDQLHPSRNRGYPLIADYLVADLIGHVRQGNYTQLRPVDMLQASRPANPYILGDLMDRADSTTSPGTASSGQAWTMTSGTLGIINKRLYAPMAGGNSARLEVGTNKFEAGITFAALDGGSSNDQYFFFRYATVANSMGIRSYANTRWELVKWVSGAITVLATDAVNLPANGDRVRVINEADKYMVYVNDRLLFQGVESANSSLTGIGIHTGTTGTRWVDAWARQLPMP